MRLYQLDGSGSVDGLTVIERDTPKPRRGEVLVRMRAASLNYLDLKILDGRFPAASTSGLVPLSDGAGEVVELGEDVTRLKLGDRVASTFFPRWIAGTLPEDGRGEQPGATRPGMLAEYIVFDANALVTVPEHLSFAEASTLTCAAVTAWQALIGPRPVLPGEVFLTQGSGGVSLFALQLAKLAGARVIVTTSDTRKFERLKALGADHVIDYKFTPDWSKEVRAATWGRGADHLIEIGERGTFDLAVAAAAVNAQINMVGRADTGVMLEASLLMQGVTTLRRISVGSRASFESMNRAVAHHKLRPVIDKIFGFDDARQAFSYFAGRTHFGKVVIAIS